MSCRFLPIQPLRLRDDAWRIGVQDCAFAIETFPASCFTPARSLDRFSQIFCSTSFITHVHYQTLYGWLISQWRTMCYRASTANSLKTLPNETLVQIIRSSSSVTTLCHFLLAYPHVEYANPPRFRVPFVVHHINLPCHFNCGIWCGLRDICSTNRSKYTRRYQWSSWTRSLNPMIALSNVAWEVLLSKMLSFAGTEFNDKE